MSVIDIILGILLIYGAYDGFKTGIVAQLGGIIGIIIGVFLAFKYGNAIGTWFGMEGLTAQICGFALILLGVVLLIALTGRLVQGIFKIAGLGAMDSILGLILGALKIGLLISVILIPIEAADNGNKWFSQKNKDESVLYKPVKGLSHMVFPYVDFVKEKLL